MEKQTVRPAHIRRRHILARLLLSAAAVVILLPVVLTALYSFFSPGEIKAFMQTRGSFDAKSLMEIKLSPNMFSLSQYYKILIEDMTILRYFVNSAMYTAAILFGQALLIPAMAYALSRFRFRGRDALFFVVIMLMLLPFQVTMVPNVITLRAMGLLDTIWAIILPMTVAPFYIFLLLTALYSFFSPGEIKAFMQTRGSFDAKSLMEIKLSPNMFSLSQYYKILIEDMTILRYFVNSAMYTAAILFGQALLIPAMAYALSRFRFRGRDALFFVVIMLMLLPFQVTMVPNVITLRAMGLLDTIWAIILPMTVAPFYIFLLRQYMVGLPGDMIEAAQIDGAGTLRCFIHVVLPVCQPILGAAVALSFADCWNLVEQPLTYLTTRTELYPLSVVFNQLTQQSTGVEFAGAALYTLPALLIYLYFQNDILEGVQLTELK